MAGCARVLARCSPLVEQRDRRGRTVGELVVERGLWSADPPSRAGDVRRLRGRRAAQPRGRTEPFVVADLVDDLGLAPHSVGGADRIGRARPIKRIERGQRVAGRDARARARWVLGARGRVIALVCVHDRLAQRVREPAQIAHGQAGLVELAEVELAVHDALDDGIDRVRLAPLDRARSGLDRVADREDRGLPGLRRDAWVAERFDGRAPRVALQLAPRPEGLQHPVAVVHVHEVDHALVQACSARRDDPLGDVREDRIARGFRRELVVRRGLARLEVLDEVLRCERLAEVVVVGADANEPSVRSDRVRRELCHVRHHQAVLPRARCPLGDLLEQRLGQVEERGELVLRDLADQQLIDRQQRSGEGGRDHRAQRGRDPRRPRRLGELSEGHVARGQVLEHRIRQRGEQGRCPAGHEQRSETALGPLRDHQTGGRDLDE